MYPASSQAVADVTARGAIALLTVAEDLLPALREMPAMRGALFVYVASPSMLADAVDAEEVDEVAGDVDLTELTQVGQCVSVLTSRCVPHWVFG